MLCGNCVRAEIAIVSTGHNVLLCVDVNWTASIFLSTREWEESERETYLFANVNKANGNDIYSFSLFITFPLLQTITKGVMSCYIKTYRY